MFRNYYILLNYIFCLILKFQGFKIGDLELNFYTEEIFEHISSTAFLGSSLI